MKDKFFLIIAFFSALFSAVSLEAARRSTYESESEIVIRELRDNVEFLKHELVNHESEIRSFEEKVRNQDSTIEAFRQQFQDSNKFQKDQLIDSTAELEVKIKSIESLTKTLVSDAKQLKDRINETSQAMTQVTNALTQYAQRISNLEKASDAQSNNITSLDTALKSIVEAIQVKETPLVSTPQQDSIYYVKSGDSLGEIALRNNTTVQVLKDINHLSSDKIVIGQKLKLPKE